MSKFAVGDSPGTRQSSTDVTRSLRPLKSSPSPPIPCHHPPFELSCSHQSLLLSIRIAHQVLKLKMLNCYTPRAAPPNRGDGNKSRSSRDGKGNRMDEDDIVINGSATATDSPNAEHNKFARSDCRAPYDMRQVYMDVGVVAHATGSAYIEFNHTKVICAVYGPRAQSGRDAAFSEEGQLVCDFSYAPFATSEGRRDPRGGKKDDERELSTLLRQTLQSSVQVHRLTKSVVDVHVMVLQADGGELAVATTCASMALADAGIELYDLVAACSVAYCGTQMVLDPTDEEERNGTGVMVVAVMGGSQQVTQWWQEGRFDGQRVTEALELCTDGCTCVHKMMEAKLKASASRDKTVRNK